MGVISPGLIVFHYYYYHYFFEVYTSLISISFGITNYRDKKKVKTVTLHSLYFYFRLEELRRMTISLGKQITGQFGRY